MAETDPVETDAVDTDAVEAGLRQEREFLLRSLTDLELEHAAGDLDDDDFNTLRDDYTARAAAALRRTTSTPEPSRPAGPRGSWGRRLAVWAGVGALAIGGGVVVARSAGERLPGGSLTGTVRNVSGSAVTLPEGCPSDITAPQPPNVRPTNARQRDIDALIAKGQQNLGANLLEALKAFDGAVAIDPDNVVGLTYGGWVRRLAVAGGAPAEFLDRAQTLLDRAIVADPTFPDARAFRGVLLLRDRADAKAAVRDFCVLELLDPPAEVRQLAATAFSDAVRAAKP